MAKNIATPVVEVKGMRQLIRVLNKLPKELQNEIRDAASAIATDQVNGAVRAAATPQQRLAAAGLKVKRDRVPTIRVGKAQLRPGVRAWDVWYGAEFGGGARPTTQQFPAHRGQDGYFFYPRARAMGGAYFNRYMDAVDKAMSAWNHRES